MPHTATATMERSLTIRVPTELHGQLTRLAKATGRTKSFYVLRGLKEQVQEYDLDEIEDIMLGIEEADRGEFATDAEINAILRK